MGYPLKSDIFNMQSVIDYERLIQICAKGARVTDSKKAYIKRENKVTKVHINRTTNK